MKHRFTQIRGRGRESLSYLHTAKSTVHGTRIGWAGPLAELLSTGLPMIDWAQAEAVALKQLYTTAVLLSRGLAEFSVALISARGAGAFRPGLCQHNFLWN